MKLLNRYCAIAALVPVLAVSCEKGFLDTDPTGWYSENVAYSSVEHLDMVVSGLYTVLYANSEIAKGYVFDDAVSDLVKESWYGVGGGNVNKLFYNGTGITPESNMLSNWGYYTYIRQLNEFFVDRYEGYMKALPSEEVDIREGEVRFLRAFAYHELNFRHRGVVLRISETKVDGPEENTKARSSEQECWDFIIGEFQKAADLLPESWPSSQAGRLTKGAALGMKARACLYAGRYEEAVKACNDVIGMNYSLMPGTDAESYNRIFTQPYNSELIIPVYYMQANNNGSKQHYFNNYFCPPGDGEAYNVSIGAAATPTDEYASSFDIKVDGKYEAFSWNNLARYGNEPFLNRDPRFYANILYNGAEWRGRKLELYVGGKDDYMDYKDSGQDNVHKSTTGYIFRKFLSEETMNYTSTLSSQYWIEMRLAEIYFIRSEAYARQGEFSLAYDDLNEIRTRVGLGSLPIKVTWETYLPDLMKEKVCEMGMEGQRLADLIRWGKAQDVLDGKYLHGIKITKSGDSWSYEYVSCDSAIRRFPAKFNVYPIPYSELKANTLCRQNDEWL